tara:strand:+ start:29250 stop:30320 length:1071 start_codon:yes stop_codon:yes gene_type:complete
MTGKIKKSNFYSLFVAITFSVLFSSYYTNKISIIFLFLISFSTSLITNYFGLKVTRKFKFLQKIREESPSRHKNKENTPTLGGLFFIPIFLIVLIFVDLNFNAIKILSIYTILGYFLIGLTDDCLSIKNKTNLGLKGRDKLAFQIVITLFLILFSAQFNLINSQIRVLENFYIDLKGFIYPISFLTVIGMSNAVNLSDGLDGLVAGCSSIIFCGLGTEILLSNSEYIGFSLLCFAMAGLSLGFLKFNVYPAKIFMGDTGSLCIGAIIGLICIFTNSFLTVLIFAGIFIVETLSVIFQVLFFKLTKQFTGRGKRIFLMSPLHHHFELIGIPEVKIVDYFWKTNILLVILGIVLKISF